MKKIIQKYQLTIGQTPTILYKFSYENTNCSRTHTTKYYKKFHMKILVKNDDQGFHHQHP